MRAKYYPNVEYEVHMTGLGMVYTTEPTLYRIAPAGQTIIEVDILDYAERVFKGAVKYPPDIVYDVDKELLRRIVDGRAGNEAFRNDVKMLLLSSSTFEHYFMCQLQFGDKNLNETQKLIQPLRNGLNTLAAELRCKHLNKLPKSKFCMQSDERLFYACQITDDYDVGLPHYVKY